MTRNILTETKIKQLKPRTKPYKISDGTISGLHLLVSPAGGKVFYLAYKFESKHKLLRLGTWPVFSLEEARDLARDAKKQIALSINPAAAKQAEKAKAIGAATTLRVVAGQWLAWKQDALGAVTTDDTVMRHSLASRANSLHSAARSSVGRTKTSGAKRNAQMMGK